jgi:hypothetical protein
MQAGDFLRSSLDKSQGVFPLKSGILKAHSLASDSRSNSSKDL